MQLTQSTKFCPHNAFHDVQGDLHTIGFIVNIVPSILEFINVVLRLDLIGGKSRKFRILFDRKAVLPRSPSIDIVSPESANSAMKSKQKSAAGGPPSTTSRQIEIEAEIAQFRGVKVAKADFRSEQILHVNRLQKDRGGVGRCVPPTNRRWCDGL